MAHAESERAARGAEIKQAIKNTACSDAAAAPWELALYADLHHVSTPPAGLRSQPHQFNKIIKYLSAPVALLSVHASFKNFASLNLLLRISSRCMHKSRRAHYIYFVGNWEVGVYCGGFVIFMQFVPAGEIAFELHLVRLDDACINADDPNRVLMQSALYCIMTSVLDPFLQIYNILFLARGDYYWGFCNVHTATNYKAA